MFFMKQYVKFFESVHTCGVFDKLPHVFCKNSEAHCKWIQIVNLPKIHA